MTPAKLALILLGIVILFFVVIPFVAGVVKALFGLLIIAGLVYLGYIVLKKL